MITTENTTDKTVNEHSTECDSALTNSPTLLSLAKTWLTEWAELKKKKKSRKWFITVIFYICEGS